MVHKGRLLPLAAAVAAAPGIVGGLQQNPGFWSGGLLNPDSFMRLVRLDDMIAAGRLLHVVARDDSGAGTIVQWSHLLDALLLVLAAPLAPWLGWHGALHAAGFVSGPLSLAALGMAVAWTAAPISRPGWLWLGAYAAAAAPVMRNYGMMGEISHHVLLAACVTMACGWALRLVRGDCRPARGGAALAAWTVAGLWLSPETMPFSLLAAGAVWLQWLRQPNTPLRPALIAHAAWLFGLTLAAVLLDPPPAGLFALAPDSISLLFVLLAAGALATALATGLGRRWPALLCAACSGAVLLAAAPQVLHGTHGLMTPDQTAAMMGGITEFAPVSSLADAINFLLGGVFAAVTVMIFAWTARRTPTASTVIPSLFYVAVCLLAGLALAATSIRFAAYPQVAGAVLLPAVLSAVSAARIAPSTQSLARLSAIILLVGAPSVYAAVAPRPPQSAGGFAGAPDCGMDRAVSLLAAHPGQIVLAAPDATPELLYRTRILTVGSLYHRSADGFMRLRAAWRSVPGDRPDAALRATGATLVIACAGAPRSVLVKGLPDTTLLDRLGAGNPPAWLKPVANSGGTTLYEISN